MFACMKKIDDLLVGLKSLKKRPVVDCGVGDGDEPEVGPRLSDARDLFHDLRRDLAGFRHPRKIYCVQTIAVPVMETDCTAGCFAPARFFVPVGAKRDHDAVKRNSTASAGGPTLRIPSRAALPFQSSPAVMERRRRWLADGFMPPNLVPPRLSACSGL